MSIKKYYLIGKKKLFLICRSLTGKGVRKTLKIIQEEFPNLKIRKIKSGTKIFDWVIPPEWNIFNAFVEDKFGNKIIDFKKNNLHLVGYSIPINKKVKKKDLLKNLYYEKNQPNGIPYITSYYKRRWGFCVSFKQFKKIKKNYSNNDDFKIVINSKLNNNGYLNYGELIIKGKSKKEILISTYICHPSMANNELSGTIVSMGLINYFRKIKNLKKTLRFIFIPETIGSIAFLNKNLNHLKKNVIGGFNLSCIGDDRQHSCILSKYQNSLSDESILYAYKKLKIKKYKIYSFLERGSDERQYNSPGIDLNIASIFRTKYGEYPEYHTSLDNFDLVTLKGINGGYKVARESIKYLVKSIIPKNIILCEPHMGKRGLYISKNSTAYTTDSTKKYMDFLQYADGSSSLEKISKKINSNFRKTLKIYKSLVKNKLIK